MTILKLNLRQSTWRFRIVWEWTDADGHYLTANQVAAIMDGKRVGLNAHGYRVKDAAGPYREIAAELAKAPPVYDVLVEVWWPASQWAPFFLLARLRAPKAGAMVHDAIAEILRLARPASIDFQAHSLGCMVALEAAKWMRGMFRHLILAAPALDNEDLSRGKFHTGDDGRYAYVSENVNSIHIFFSKLDMTGPFYFLMRRDKMMGVYGADRDMDLAANVSIHDYTGKVSRHSGYRKLREYFDEWRRIAGVPTAA